MYFSASTLLFLASTTSAAATLPRPLPDLDLRSSGHAYQLDAQADGKLVVAGFYTELGNAATTNIGRLNVDGSPDPSWHPGITAAISTMAVSMDDNVYVALWPYSVVKISLNGSGAPDTSFHCCTDFEETVYALALDGDYVYTANESGGLRRYNASSGNLDAAWSCAASGLHLIADHAGHLYVDAARINIGDGTLDAAWAAPLMVNGTTATALGSDGYLYVGSQGAIGDGGIEGLARLRIDTHGTIDSVWHPVSPGDAASSAFNAIRPLDDGSVIVGGTFEHLGGGVRRNIARLIGPQGDVDTAWIADADGAIEAIAIGPSGSVVAAGNFTAVGGVPRASIARLVTHGNPDPAFVGGIYADASVLAITADPAHGRTYVGGQFDWVGTERHRNILRLGADGNIDSAWTPDTDTLNEWPYYSGGIRAILVASEDVYIGGAFSNVNGISRHSLAKLGAAAPGLLDPTWNPDPRGNWNADVASATVDALAIDALNRLIIGGDFRKIGDVAQEMLARIHADGTLDASWRPDPVYPIRRIAYRGNNDLYFIVDNFSTQTSYPGKIILDTAQFDFTWDQAARFQPAYDMVLAGDSLLVAGDNETVPANSAIRLSTTTGVRDPGWAPASECRASRLAVDDSGAIYASGNLPGADAQACLYRIGANGDIDSTFTPTWLLGTRVSALAVANDGVVFAGGYFSNVSGGRRRSLVAFDNADSIFNSGFDR